MWLAKQFIIRILNYNFAPNAKKKAMTALKGLKLVLIHLGKMVLFIGSIIIVPWGLGRLLEWITGWKIPSFSHDNPAAAANCSPLLDHLAPVWIVGLGTVLLGLAIYGAYRYCLSLGGWEEKNNEEDEWDQARDRIARIVRREAELQRRRSL